MCKTACAALCALAMLPAAAASAQDAIYFSATDNVTNVLVQRINAETVRLDISSWYLSEHAISIAIANRFAAGVKVRIIGDRGAIFEADPHTKAEYYWLANKGIPIRLRFNPTWFPEINHWKMALFVGQNLVEFGSGNFAPTELAPVSATNYSDETELFTTDPAIVNAFKTKFDVMWNDTTVEPQSIIASPPYLKDWYDACANEPTGNCKDFATLYPTPAPMIVNTARLEGDNPSPPDLIWGQGRDFNNRLVQEINSENSRIDLIVYRLEVDNITNALLQKFQAGVPVRIIVDPGQYTNILYPEYWLTHANIDKLWAAGVPILQTRHAGVTHMKTLVTSTYATNASSNFGPNWQRDHDYFIAKATKPAIYQAIADRVNTMWNDTAGFGPLVLTKPRAATVVSPANSTTGVATTTPLVWNIAAWAVSYDVYLGTTSANMTLAGNVPARMVTNPPTTYSFTPSSLQAGTTYFWKVVSRTNATPLNSSMIATSATWTFTTAGAVGPPPAPSNPNPASGAIGVSTAPVLSWAPGAPGTTFNVAFGTSNPPPQVATGLTTASFATSTLAANTAYFWTVTAVSSNGTTAGSIWSFTTGTGGAVAAPEVVIYATDVSPDNIHESWSQVPDATAAAGIKLSNVDAGVAALTAPLANPTQYFDASFNAVSGRRYRVWLRMRAINNSKFNDSVFVQFNDSTNSSGSAIYRTGTTGALMVNLATDAGAASVQNWGWQRNAYWLSDTGDVWFQNNGTHTIRVQVREDGVEIDQIVISPSNYATNSPGTVSNDNTIVPQPSAQPPATPGSPNPASGTTGVSTALTLTWSAAGATTYDVRFGTTNPPEEVSSGQAAASFNPGTLASGTQYFWQIVASNAAGPTPGPVWSFTTSAAPPPPPGTPGSPSPTDGSTGLGTALSLTWTSTGASSYDVRFGTANPPPQVSANQTAASFTTPTLASTTQYFWQIVGRNSSGTTTGPVWSFTTGAAPPPPPGTPGSPSPTDGSTGLGTALSLTWTSTGASSYDVRFGTANPPPQVSANQTAASFTTPTLASNTRYFWQIVGRNSSGTTTGPVWSFTTSAAPPPPPGTPGSPSPTDGSTGLGTALSLTWTSTGASSYDVRFGTANPPPQVSANQTAASFTTPTLASNTRYFWQIVGRNTSGTTTGPVWSFTTAAAPANTEIVIYAGDIPTANLHGSWSVASDPTSPGGLKLATTDAGFAATNNALAAPAHYVDVTFDANANTPYRLWLRMQALGNNKFNDSLWVQFFDAKANGSPVYPINTTSGLDVNLATDSIAGSLNQWGWQNGAYWLSQTTTFTFATGGTHTMRIQVREDGVQLDQIVLSSSQFLSASPGSVTNDTTIVPKP